MVLALSYQTSHPQKNNPKYLTLKSSKKELKGTPTQVPTNPRDMILPISEILEYSYIKKQ